MTMLVLVVDDEPDVETLFRQHFRRDTKAGRFDLEFAPSAEGALEIVVDKPDLSLILILSDINMPGMSGLDFLPIVKAERPEVPVLMVTAYGDDDTERLAIESGAAGLLSKPVDFARLRGEIFSRLEEI